MTTNLTATIVVVFLMIMEIRRNCCCSVSKIDTITIVMMKKMMMIQLVDVVLGKSALVVMHPNLEHPFLDSDFCTKPRNQILVFPLHLPPNPLRELQHLLLLILTELRPEPLPPARIRTGVVYQAAGFLWWDTG